MMPCAVFRNRKSGKSNHCVISTRGAMRLSVIDSLFTDSFIITWPLGET
jgi:hypothetical protein